MNLLLRSAIGLTALGSTALAHELPKAPSAPPDFDPPAAGSYALPPIQAAPTGTVLDARGKRHDLKAFTTGKVTLLSLFYAQCADPEGCPAAFNAMIDLRDRLAREPRLSRSVRLVSLSFDPKDTPELLQAFGHHLASSKVSWSFLAGASPEGLASMLDGFGQDIAVEEEGDATHQRVITHMLKLFLIDRHGQVREIYTTAFLQPEVMLNDILTLLIEDGLAQR